MPDGRWQFYLSSLISFRTITNLTTRLQTALFPSSLNFKLNCYLEPNPCDVVYFQNRALDNLIKFGNLTNAQNLFDEIPIRDAVSYNILISGHGKLGSPKRAIGLYQEMVSNGIRENPSTFSSVLSICSQMEFDREGVQVHCRVVKLGMGLNLFIGTSLVGLYMRMWQLELGLGLFGELPEKSLAVWNLVLRGFCEVGRHEELLGLFEEMRMEGLEVNGLSFCYLIRGCCDERFLDEGRQLHCLVVKLGWVESNIFVANGLVDFYSSCGRLIDVRKLLLAIPLGDVISWNSILSVHARNGLLLEALALFYVMQSWGMRPSIRSYVALLNLSSKTRDVQLGKQIHGCVLKVGLDSGSIHVQSAVIDMYGKNGDIESSVCVFEGIPEAERTLECCNSLMTSLWQAGFVNDVIEMFGLMIDEGIGLDEVALSTTLNALCDPALANLASCGLVHCCMIKLGFEYDITVLCSLINSYSRSGNVQLSLQVFQQLPSPNVFCFTSMISGLARNGMGKECLGMLEAMIREGLKPDEVTFLCLLTGCSHCGLVEEGRLVFDSMKALHGISPRREHFSCMVDLLGRAGLVCEAEELLQQAPGRGDYVMWSSLLQSCKIHKDEAVGRRAAKVLLERDSEDVSVYLQISSFYSEIGEFEASRQVRESAIARKLMRDIGYSVVEVSNHS